MGIDTESSVVSGVLCGYYLLTYPNDTHFAVKIFKIYSTNANFYL